MAVAALVAVVALSASGCGGGGGGGASAPSTTTETPPPFASEPYTRQQKLVERGAQLVVADGCSACHLQSGRRSIGPSFLGFAGHRFTLRDGARVLVDEAFVRRALSHPGRFALKGYDPASMREVLARTRLYERPREIEALAAFIEQVGPED